MGGYRHREMEGHGYGVVRVTWIMLVWLVMDGYAWRVLAAWVIGSLSAYG